MNDTMQEITDPVALADDSCWFCNDSLRDAPPPGGWLIEDKHWRVGAAPATYAIPGAVILEARRHVLDQAAFNESERRDYADVTGRVIGAIRASTGCDRVYQWATMDAYPHFHLWLLPWWTDSTERGPAYLSASVLNITPDENATARAAKSIATELGATA
ncbi:MAG TPA: hypothetical protein VFV89_08415 [Nocardioides sp.]|uniref:hypothetical protein n=1 Tax=Nocardioides sp. TaxID=35761 RepID=UPI002E303370|nr:hypothetical protein [Nocardioides sp.]HEX5087817.1 hypothetical protein [Nocardioides sp.]